MPTVTTIYDWKISIIAQFNKSWAPEYDEFIAAIRKQTISARLRFIVLTYNSPDDPSATGTASIKHYFRGMPKTIDPEPTPFDLYDQTTLNEFFSQEVLPIKAARHMFIVWGHGAGLGFFPTIAPGSFTTQAWFSQVFDPVPVVDHDKKKEALDSKDLANAINFLQANFSMRPNFAPALGSYVSFGDQVYKIRDHTMIHTLFKVVSVDQLAKALGILDQKTDIFIASNCYSQIFDAGFALKDKVEIMIAAETPIPISGFSYLPFFRNLRNAKSVPKDDSPADQTYLDNLTINLVSKFNSKYTNSYLKKLRKKDTTLEYDKDSISLSGNRLSVYPQLQEVVASLGTILSASLPLRAPADFSSAIHNARTACRDLASPSDNIGTIDLTFFLHQLQQRFDGLNNKDLDPIVDKLEKIRKDCTIAILSPKALSTPTMDPFSPAGRKIFNCQNPQFLAIYCPLSSGTGQMAIQDSLFKLFKEQTSNSAHLPAAKPWDNFVLQFHG